MNKVEYSSASICSKYCTDCGWPVVEVCCNGNFLDKISEVAWDWWVYCSNKSCVNHEGEGQFQNSIDWMNEDLKTTITNVSLVKIPLVSRESVQELSDKYVGCGISQHLEQSIDDEIEYRRRLLKHGYLPDEEIDAIYNEIKYLGRLAGSLY